MQFGAGFWNAPIDRDALLVYQALQRSAAQKWNAVDQVAIESLVQVALQYKSHLDRRVVIAFLTFIERLKFLRIDLVGLYLIHCARLLW